MGSESIIYPSFFDMICFQVPNVLNKLMLNTYQVPGTSQRNVHCEYAHNCLIRIGVNDQ